MAPYPPFSPSPPFPLLRVLSTLFLRISTKRGAFNGETLEKEQIQYFLLIHHVLLKCIMLQPVINVLTLKSLKAYTGIHKQSWLLALPQFKIRCSKAKRKSIQDYTTLISEALSDNCFNSYPIFSLRWIHRNTDRKRQQKKFTDLKTITINFRLTVSRQQFKLKYCRKPWFNLFLLEKISFRISGVQSYGTLRAEAT